MAAMSRTALPLPEHRSPGMHRILFHGF